MEQILNEGLYTINLEQVNTAQEIIFQLSSALDNEEARGKRICLRLGMLDLNQAQLLSIKSLINGIESTLSTISTKSIETEKTALSLGIIVSNISNSTPEIDNVMPYKSAAVSTNGFLAAANEYSNNGCYVMDWVTNYQPNVDEYRAALVSALNKYNADQSAANWELVRTAFVDGWAFQYKEANK
jgi:hypothetical protein